MKKRSIVAGLALWCLVICTNPASSRNYPTGENRPRDERQQLVETVDVPEASTSVPASTSMPMGFYASPGLVVGTTNNDLQQNSRMGRQVERGTDGRIHFVWSYAPNPYSAGQRRVYYRSYTTSAGFDAVFDASNYVGKTPGRFCNIDVYQNRALIVDHYTHGSNITVTSKLDVTSGGQAFMAVDPPGEVVDCQGIVSGSSLFQPYIWPVVAADQDVSGNLIVHILASEGNSTTTDHEGLVYFRGNPGVTYFTPGMYGPCGRFIDSIDCLAYDIAQDPNSGKVVIAYAKPKCTVINTPDRDDNDLAYVLSTDRGVTWGPITNVTNYPRDPYPGAQNLFQPRMGQDVSVLFAADGCFHILFVKIDDFRPHYYNTNFGLQSSAHKRAKLMHWSSCKPPNCPPNVVEDAYNLQPSCKDKPFEYNVCQSNISQCISNTLHDTLLYATYTRYYNYDCGANLYPNGEIIMKASGTWGDTWGARTNLTNSATTGCSGCTCADDHYSSCARYNVDSLRIEYMQDLDPGRYAAGDPSTADCTNPILFRSYSCVQETYFSWLVPSTFRIGYPFHAPLNSSAVTSIALSNDGNQDEPVVTSITYTGGPATGWLSCVPSSFTIPRGCTGARATDSIDLIASTAGFTTEGVYTANVTFNYSGSADIVKVDLYAFNDFHLPQTRTLPTQTIKLGVQQTGRCGWLAWNTDDTGYPNGEVYLKPDSNSFTYNADGNLPYLYDASLIIGNSANNLSTMIYRMKDSLGTDGGGMRPMFALSDLRLDSTDAYGVASGKACNGDSTIAFFTNIYASRYVDSNNFYVAYFKVFKGVNNPTGTVTGVSIAFATDWDIPGDSGAINTAGTDSSLQMLYQRGLGDANGRYGAIAAFRADNNPITGGFVWDNAVYVYPVNGYQVDSLWNHVQGTNSVALDDSEKDFSSVLVVGKNLTINGGTNDTLRFAVVLAGQSGGARSPDGSLDGLKMTIEKAKKFISGHILGNWYFPPTSVCGDANSGGTVNISDAVYLIAYIFSGGPAPAPLLAGDANCSGSVNISDAVYLIAYIFSGGPTPCAECK